MKNHNKNPLDDFYNFMGELTKPLSISQLVIQNDKRIENIAFYQITKGCTDLPNLSSHSDSILKQLKGQSNPLESTETEEPTFYEKLKGVFTEMKGLIMRGTFTLDELEDRVYAQYGVVSDFSKQKAGVLPKDKQLAKEIDDILREATEQ